MTAQIGLINPVAPQGNHRRPVRHDREREQERNQRGSTTPTEALVEGSSKDLRFPLGESEWYGMAVAGARHPKQCDASHKKLRATERPVSDYFTTWVQVLPNYVKGQCENQAATALARSLHRFSCIAST